MTNTALCKLKKKLFGNYSWVVVAELTIYYKIKSVTSNNHSLVKCIWSPVKLYFLLYWFPKKSTHGTSLSQRDSKLLHEIKASGQLVKDCNWTQIAQPQERFKSDMNSMHSPNVEHNNREESDSHKWLSLFLSGFGDFTLKLQSWVSAFTICSKTENCALWVSLSYWSGLSVWFLTHIAASFSPVTIMSK